MASCCWAQEWGFDLEGLILAWWRQKTTTPMSSSWCNSSFQGVKIYLEPTATAPLMAHMQLQFMKSLNIPWKWHEKYQNRIPWKQLWNLKALQEHIQRCTPLHIRSYTTCEIPSSGYACAVAVSMVDFLAIFSGFFCDVFSLILAESGVACRWSFLFIAC